MSRFIYLITKDEEISADFADNLSRIFDDFSGHIYALQIRIKDKISAEKSAEKLKDICERYGIPLIMNDFLDLAHDLGGIHVGRDDTEIEECLKLRAMGKIVGVSCYNDIERATTMCKKCVSYVSFGCFYHSATKPNPVAFADQHLLKKWREINNKTLTVAIGGINSENFIELISAGANLIAVSSYAWNDVLPYKRIEKLVRCYDIQSR